MSQIANYSLGTVQGEIRIDYDGGGVREAQADVKAAAKQLEREKLQLKLGADRTQLTKDIALAMADLAKWSAMEPSAEVNIEVERARATLIGLESQLATLDRRRIEIQVDIDNARLEAASNKMLSTFSGLRSRVADFGADVRNTSDAVEGLGSTMSAASKVVFLAGAASQLGVFVAALAPAVGALAALPAVGFAVGAAFGVVKIATSGMGDAFKAVADGDAKALAEAMKELSPEAQKVVREYQRLQPALDALKLNVQNAFWKDQAQVLNQLAGTYLPMMNEELTMIAHMMGAMVSQSAEALMDPETVAALNTVLQGTTELFSELGPAPGEFLSGLINMAAVGAQYLGQVGLTLNQLATQFNNWTKSAEGQAKINSWIQQGWQVLTQLWNILTNIASIAMSVFGPLTSQGEGLLATLVRLTAQAAAWASSAEGQQVIGQIWQSLSIIASTLASAIGFIVAVVAQLLVWFSQLPGPVQSVIAGFLVWGSIIGVLLAKMAPLIGFLIQIAPLIMRLGPLLTGLATAFRVVMTAFRALTVLMMTNPWVLLIAAVIALVAIIVTNWDTIKSYLSAAWNFILAAWNAFVGALSSTGSTVWSTISAAWTSAISALKSFFSSVWSGVTAVWNMFISSIIAIGSAVWETIKTIWFAAILTIWALLTGQFDLLGTIWSTLISKIKAIGSNLWNEIKGIWGGAIAGIISTVTNFVSNVVSAISSFVSRVIAFFTNLGSQIVSRVSSFVSSAISFFSNLATQGPSRISAMVSSIISYVGNLASQFVARVSSMASQVVARMGALAGQIVSAIASLPGRMVSLGASIISGIISGISGAAGRLFSYLGGLATQALNAAKAAFGINSPSKLFRDTIGESIPEGIEVGVGANVSGMLKSVNDLAGMAQKAALDALSRPELARVGSLVGANTASASGTMLGASTAAAIAPSGGSSTMTIGTLAVNVQGIVDPTDPVAWRRFGEDLKDLIKDVEDSYK